MEILSICPLYSSNFFLFFVNYMQGNRNVEQSLLYGNEELKSYIITRYSNHFYTCSCQRMTPSIIVE